MPTPHGACVPAKPLTRSQLGGLLAHVEHRKAGDPLRDACVLQLSFRAGLRVAEIASLDWTDVTYAQGCLADAVTVPAGIKGGAGRAVPMHPALADALQALRARDNPTSRDPFAAGTASV